MKEKDWFRIKRYPHIGLPLTKLDRSWVEAYVKDEDKIISHGFLPFIHRVKKVRKFRKQTLEDGKKSELREKDSKPRELFFANHLDANVFSYYANILSSAYENKLIENEIEDCVTAYRRIKINPLDEASSHKSNSDFASDVFNFILTSKEEKVIAITFDIKSFFDTLDHKKLKMAWCQIFDKTTLKRDHYNIFKNITNFSFINENQIFKEFKNDIIVETKTGIRKRRKIDKLRYLRNQRAIAFCNRSEFIGRILDKNLVINNKFCAGKDRVLRDKGIPQGSPISAILANIYMVKFDHTINHFIKSIKGLYRRYSDDMVIVCPEQYEKDIIKLFHDEIKERQLEIQDKKTQTFKFIRNGNRYNCYRKIGDLIAQGKNFEYLGFEFDGYYSFIKSASLSGFYRKMKRSINRGKYYATIDKNKQGIYKSRLYKKFSYKGAKRKRVFVKDKIDPNILVKNERHDWGNFISYAHLSIRKLPNNKIKGQIKRHWKILNKLMK